MGEFVKTKLISSIKQLLKMDVQHAGDDFLVKIIIMPCDHLIEIKSFYYISCDPFQVST